MTECYAADSTQHGPDGACLGGLVLAEAGDNQEIILDAPPWKTPSRGSTRSSESWREARSSGGVSSDRGDLRGLGLGLGGSYAVDAKQPAVASDGNSGSTPSMNSSTSPTKFETAPPGENVQIGETIFLTRQLLQQRYPNSMARRGVHPKDHGCVQAASPSIPIFPTSARRQRVDRQKRPHGFHGRLSAIESGRDATGWSSGQALRGIRACVP